MRLAVLFGRNIGLEEVAVSDISKPRRKIFTLGYFNTPQRAKCSAKDSNVSRPGLLMNRGKAPQT